ncbi:MAG: ATP synthase subunit I [Pseudomonadota bacterium]|nr:ATP synthase subunit I [Pseudomonadota bacterium]
MEPAVLDLAESEAGAGDSGASGAARGRGGIGVAVGPVDAAEQEGVRPWTREEARAWQQDNPSPSPWRVVAAQAAAGLLCAALAWGYSRHGETAWSALYGAAAVVVPNALLARGMTRGTRHPLAQAAGFMFWEMLKIGASVAMLAAAVKVVPHLSWPALLVTMVVCIKVNWLALLWRGRRSDKKA